METKVMRCMILLIISGVILCIFHGTLVHTFTVELKLLSALFKKN